MNRIALAVLVLAALLVLPAAHCNPKAGWNALVTCEAPSVKTDLPQVLPLVVDILLSKGSDAAADAALAGLAVKMGKDLVECSVVAAIAAFTTPPSTQPTAMWRPGVPTRDDSARAVARGNAWLKAQGITVEVKP